MVSMLPTCGNCRRRNDKFQREIVLEMDEEDPFFMGEGTIPTTAHVVRELTGYRPDRRYTLTTQGPCFGKRYLMKQTLVSGSTITISWSCSPDCFRDTPCMYMA